MAKNRLKFNKALSKCPSASVYISRLSELFQEIKNYGQQDFEKESLSKVAAALPKLFMHRDLSVRAHVGQCLVEVLRLYAPDPPYDSTDCESLFQFLFQQLKYLADATVAHANEYHHILDSLIEVQTIAIIAELDTGSELFETLLARAFDILDGNESVLPQLVDLISLAVNAFGADFPDSGAAALVAPFVRQKARGKSKAGSGGEVDGGGESAREKLAATVISQSSEHLVTPFRRYFEGLLVGGQDKQSKGKGKGKDAKTMAKAAPGPSTATASPMALLAHAELRKLAPIAPLALTSVANLLADELESTEAFDSLAALFEQPSTHSEAAGAWHTWLAQAHSRLTARRLRLLEHLGRVWPHNARLSADIEPAVTTLLTDTDERVRTAACALCGRLDYDVVLFHASPTLLRTVTDRVKDTRAGVSAAAGRTAAAWFRSAYVDPRAVDATAAAKFGWIPAALYSALTYGDARSAPYVRQNLTQLTFSDILPLEYEEPLEKWVDRLLVVADVVGGASQRGGAGWDTLTDSAHASANVIAPEQAVTADTSATPLPLFLSFSHLRGDKQSSLRRLVTLFEDLAAGTVERASVDAYMMRYASQFLRPDAVRRDLAQLADLGDSDVLAALRVLSDTDASYAALVDARGVLCTRPALAELQETLGLIVANAAPFIFNPSTVGILLGDMRKERTERAASEALSDLGELGELGDLSELADASQPEKASDEQGLGPLAPNVPALIRYAARHRPTLFSSLIPLLHRRLMADGSVEDAETVLYVLSRLARTSATDAARILSGSGCMEALTGFCDIASPRTAKYAATVLACDADTSAATLEALMNRFTDDLTLTSVHSVARLACLYRIARLAPADSVVAFLDRDQFAALLSAPEEAEETALNEGSAPDEGGASGEAESRGKAHPSWVPEEQLPQATRARIACLKLLTHQAITLSLAHPEETHTYCSALLTDLWRIVSETSPTKSESHTNGLPPFVASALRYHASQALIKLATLPALRAEFNARLPALAALAQDPCYEVRFGFAEFLMRQLRGAHASQLARFRIVLYMTAHDPEQELIDSVKFFVQSEMRSMAPAVRVPQLEHPLFRLLHLIAHNADFRGDVNDTGDLVYAARYICLFLDSVACAANVSYLFAIATLLKTVRDSSGAPAVSRRLYVLSELAQHLIRSRAKARGWNIDVSTAKLALPRDIFRRIEDTEEVRKVQSMQLITPETLAALDARLRRQTAAARRPAPRKRAASTSDHENDSESEYEKPTRKRGRAKSKKARSKSVKSRAGTTKPREALAPTRRVPTRQARPSRGTLIESDTEEEEEEEEGEEEEEEDDISGDSSEDANESSSELSAAESEKENVSTAAAHAAGKRRVLRA